MQSNWLRQISKTYIHLKEESGSGFVPAPKRADFSSDEEFSNASKQWAERTKSQANTDIARSKAAVSAIDVATPVLKGVELAADTALSAGAVAVPGVGTVLNSTVKGLKAGMAAQRGDYVGATVNALDAAIPYAGKLAKTASTVKTGTDYLTKPVATAVGQLAKSETVKSVAKPVLNTATNVVQKGLSSLGKETTSDVAAKTATTAISKLGSGSIKQTNLDKSLTGIITPTGNSTNSNTQSSDNNIALDRFNKSRFSL